MAGNVQASRAPAMPDASLLLLAAFIASFVSVVRRHRQIARDKRELLERLDRMAQHRDLVRRR